jgi:hypothetical protein
MPPTSRSRGGESKQGLVITLVLFVLATLILAVTTYFGYGEADAKAKAAADAANKLKETEKALAYYQFQARYYRTLMGHTDGIDMGELANLKDQFDKGQLGTKEKDFDQVKNMVAGRFDKGDLAWDAAQKKPRNSYEALLAKARADYDQQVQQREGIERNRMTLEKERDAARTDLEEAKKQFASDLKKIAGTAKADLEKEKTDLTELQTKLKDMGEQMEVVRKTADDDVKRSKADTKKKDAQLRQTREALDARMQELAATKLKSNEAPSTARTDWKIVRMNRTGQQPYINLGSADYVKPQLTFSIHAVGLDGRALPKSKGTLEVVNVLGDHLSQARVTSATDPLSSPIQVGDILYNPLWNPALKKHVALAGIVDLSGAARDPGTGQNEFLRTLEREGVVVDAYIDPKDFAVKGPGINVQTDYLIVQDSAQAIPEDRTGETIRKLEAVIQKMRDQAKENGVTIISVRKYLEMVGYRVPPHLAEPSGVSPLYKPRGDQPMLPSREPGLPPAKDR